MIAKLVLQRESATHNQPTDSDFQLWVETTLKKSDAAGEVVVRLVDEVESAALNDQYRGKAGPTNVLSFASELLAEMPLELAAELAAESGGRPVGDLIICAPVVEREAAEQGKLPQAHWAHMVVHGVLHLLGHDHQLPDEAQRMETLEIEILQKMGYPDPYQVTN